MDESQIGAYKILRELGKGSFGVVYEVINMKDNNKYALKIEDPNIERSQLENEYQVYVSLCEVQGVPRVYYYGEDKNYRYLVISLLSTSLSQLRSERRRFTLKTACMIMKRIFKTLEEIHLREWIYRDMKPDNILVGDDKIYLIDFGMSKKFTRHGRHIPLLSNKVLTGTARYASVNTHNGYEQSRRDDLEAFMYVIIYLMLGALPWMGIPAPTRKEKYKKIGEVKENTTPEILCNALPASKYFVTLLKYVKSLDFEEKPDYDYIGSIIDKMMTSNNIVDDGIFDWIVKSNTESGELEEDEPDLKKKGPWESIKSFFK